ncbi:unnamed protein product, partial [Bubo scandiacus]
MLSRRGAACCLSSHGENLKTSLFPLRHRLQVFWAAAPTQPEKAASQKNKHPPSHPSLWAHFISSRDSSPSSGNARGAHGR